MSVIGFWVLKSNGLLLPDVNEGLQLLVMYPFTMWGSVASDLDHHWDSCPSKDAPSWCVNKVLHLTSSLRDKMKDSLGNRAKKSMSYKLAGVLDASHRSWQTHSDLLLITILLLLWLVLTGSFGGTVIDTAIASLVLTGICLGVIAHLILDMLTPQGIWCMTFVGINKLISMALRRKFVILPERLHFVPHIQFFATGGTWEIIIKKILEVCTVISAVYVLILLYGYKFI